MYIGVTSNDSVAIESPSINLLISLNCIVGYGALSQKVFHDK